MIVMQPNTAISADQLEAKAGEVPKILRQAAAYMQVLRISRALLLVLEVRSLFRCESYILSS